MVGEPDTPHELHVDEPGVFLLNVLQLLVGGVAYPLLHISGHADEVGDYLHRVHQALAEDQLDHLQGGVADLSTFKDKIQISGTSNYSPEHYGG